MCISDAPKNSSLSVLIILLHLMVESAMFFFVHTHWKYWNIHLTLWNNFHFKNYESNGSVIIVGWLVSMLLAGSKQDVARFYGKND
jgi:hypothetical protein